MTKRLLLPLIALLAATSCNRKSIDDRIAEDVAHFNRVEAPKRMDEFTMMDSIGYDRSARRLNYFYTIAGISDSLITADTRSQLEDILLQHLRSNIKLRAYKEAGLHFHYIYLSAETRNAVLDVEFAPEDYK